MILHVILFSQFHANRQRHAGMKHCSRPCREDVMRHGSVRIAIWVSSCGCLVAELNHGTSPMQNLAAVAGWTALREVTPLQSSGHCGSLWPCSISISSRSCGLDGAGRSDARAKFKAVFLGQLSVAEFARYVFQLSLMSILGGNFDALKV